MPPDDFGNPASIALTYQRFVSPAVQVKLVEQATKPQACNQFRWQPISRATSDRVCQPVGT
ncbi:MAG: hypothetical protein CMJ64_04565 [Planctomycetaceae bacterium]|nr:hypothetical protein [Planctomycetaceae bacterium]